VLEVGGGTCSVVPGVIGVSPVIEYSHRKILGDHKSEWMLGRQCSKGVIDGCASGMCVLGDIRCVRIWCVGGGGECS